MEFLHTRETEVKGSDILSMKEMQKEQILCVLDKATQISVATPKDLLKGVCLANCFFEPSTRTRLSFEAAMKRLGGEVIGFSEKHSTSAEKGESLHDAMKVIGSYADLIVIRHPLEGAARVAAEATDKPVINAGDGANEHPTQTLLDLFSIKECQGRLEKLHIACVGDLLNGRTVHSLAYALSHFDCRLYFVSPPSLPMPETVSLHLRKCGIPFSSHSAIEEVIDKVDILYMTRVQQERFVNSEEYFKVKDHFILTLKMLTNAKPTLKILHPLPRVNEIESSIDHTPYAYYFKQAEHGLAVREAILVLLSGK